MICRFRGSYHECFKKVSQLLDVDLDHAQATGQMAFMFDTGLGVRRDDDQAASCMRLFSAWRLQGTGQPWTSLQKAGQKQGGRKDPLGVVRKFWWNKKGRRLQPCAHVQGGWESEAGRGVASHRAPQQMSTSHMHSCKLVCVHGPTGRSRRLVSTAHPQMLRFSHAGQC